MCRHLFINSVNWTIFTGVQLDSRKVILLPNGPVHCTRCWGWGPAKSGPIPRRLNPTPLWSRIPARHILELGKKILSPIAISKENTKMSGSAVQLGSEFDYDLENYSKKYWET